MTFGTIIAFLFIVAIGAFIWLDWQSAKALREWLAVNDFHNERRLLAAEIEKLRKALAQSGEPR